MDTTEPMRTLSVVVAPEPQGSADDTKGLFRRADESVVKAIPLDRLQDELDRLRCGIGELIDGGREAENQEFHLKEISAQVEITASGGINLIGTATVGATAAMTLTFARL